MCLVCDLLTLVASQTQAHWVWMTAAILTREAQRGTTTVCTRRDLRGGTYREVHLCPSRIIMNGDFFVPRLMRLTEVTAR